MIEHDWEQLSQKYLSSVDCRDFLDGWKQLGLENLTKNDYSQLVTHLSLP